MIAGDTRAYEYRPAIPTVSEWGLVVMALLVLTAGAIVLAKRKGLSAI